METKVFLIHGFEGAPNGGWRPWLMGKLGKEDVYCCALPMPSPESPNKEAWLQVITDSVQEATTNVILVGHSLGVPAILQYLQALPSGVRIGCAILVSGPIENMGKGERASRMDSFFHPLLDFEKIKQSADSFVIIHGDNDSAVPFAHAETLSEKLAAKLICVKDGGHLNGSAGYYELPEALEAITDFISNYKFQIEN